MFSLYSKRHLEGALLPPSNPQYYSLLIQGTVVVVASQVPARTFSPLSFTTCQEQSQGLLCHCRRMAQLNKAFVLLCYVSGI